MCAAWRLLRRRFGHSLLIDGCRRCAPPSPPQSLRPSFLHVFFDWLPFVFPCRPLCWSTRHPPLPLPRSPSKPQLLFSSLVCPCCLLSAVRGRFSSPLLCRRPAPCAAVRRPRAAPSLLVAFVFFSLCSRRSAITLQQRRCVWLDSFFSVAVAVVVARLSTVEGELTCVD